MKKILNIFILFATGLFLLSSCDTSQKGPEYIPEQGDGQFAFSTPKIGKQMFLEGVPQKVEVFRNNTVGPATVLISNTQTTNGKPVRVLDIPTQVEFADGQAKAEFEIYSNSSMVVKVNYDITLTIAESDWTVGGAQTLSYVAGLEYTWESLGKGQYFDQFALLIDTDSEAGLNIENVEVYKAKGYDLWKMIEPFADRDAIKANWGNATKDYTHEWTVYRKKGQLMSWDGGIYPGIMHDAGGPIVYEVPSTINADAYGEMDNNIFYDEAAGIMQLAPAVSIEGTTSWFGQVEIIWLGLPGSDLASILL